jgi:hypothetical protein
MALTSLIFGHFHPDFAHVAHAGPACGWEGPQAGLAGLGLICGFDPQIAGQLAALHYIKRTVLLQLPRIAVILFKNKKLGRNISYLKSLKYFCRNWSIFTAQIGK